MLKWDVGNVGSVLSPYMVDFMNPGDLWKEKMAPADVHHRPVDCDRHELSPPAETGGAPCPCSHIWLEDRREYREGGQEGVMTMWKSP